MPATPNPTPILLSTSAANDGGFIAIADLASAAIDAGLGDDYRLLGGVAVMLHVQRLGLDLPLRATSDADYGVPPKVLNDGRLVAALEARGYQKVMGNRWERAVDTRTAAVDLLIPAYTSRPRHTRRVGSVVTTEVPGLAEAFLRPPVDTQARLVLTTGERLETRVVLPDPAAMLILKAGARTVRDEARDATDLWRCLEVAYASGLDAVTFDADDNLVAFKPVLERELAVSGRALPAITDGLTAEAATRITTRIQALLRHVTGI